MKNFSDFLIGFGFSMSVFSTWLVWLCDMDLMIHFQSFENSNFRKNDSLSPPLFCFLVTRVGNTALNWTSSHTYQYSFGIPNEGFFVCLMKNDHVFYTESTIVINMEEGKKNYYVRAWNNISRGHKNDNEFHSLSQSLNEEGFDLMPKWLPYWRVCIYRCMKWRENANLSL